MKRRRQYSELSTFALDASSYEETPEGYLIIDATLARVGVLTRTIDGRPRQEFRSDRSVFGDMDRLGVLPVTALHPHNGREHIPADASNYRAVNVGHVLEGSQRRVEHPDGDRLVAKLVIQDQPTIDAIKSGELREVSMGYFPTREWRRGEHNGDPYEVVQTAAHTNHIALVPVGRAGPDVRLHIDSAGDAFLMAGDSEDHDGAPRLTDTHEETMKERINGKTYEVGTDEHAAALAADAEQRAADKAEREKLAADAADAEKLRAENAELKTQNAELVGKVASLEALDVDALADERATLRIAADAAGVEVAPGTSNAEIRKAIVQKRAPKIDVDSMDEAQVAAVLIGLDAVAPAPAPSGISRATTVTEPPTTDAADVPPHLAARAEMNARVEGRAQES